MIINSDRPPTKAVAVAVDMPVLPRDGRAGYRAEVLGSWLQSCAVSAGRLFLFGAKGLNALWELSLLQALTGTASSICTNPLMAQRGSAKFT